MPQIVRIEYSGNSYSKNSDKFGDLDYVNMDISPKQYAAALYGGIKDGKHEELKAAVKEFASILAFNNDLSKANEIIFEFEKIWNKENKIVDARIIGARELDQPTLNLLNGYIKKLSNLEQVISRLYIDKKLLGGVVLKYGDKILDASLKTRLDNLKNEMIK